RSPTTRTAQRPAGRAPFFHLTYPHPFRSPRPHSSEARPILRTAGRNLSRPAHQLPPCPRSHPRTSIRTLVLQPVRKPLAQTTQSVHQKPRLAGARQVVGRTRIAHELHRHVTLPQRREPLLRIGHRRAMVLLALHNQRRRSHTVHITNRRQGVVQRRV